MENQSHLVQPLKGTPYRGPSEPYRTTSFKGPSEWKKPKTLKGPKRAIRLILLGIILPGLFIAVPLYLKHRVYDYQVYPIGMSDMRLIDNKVSTTWCQRQLVKSNGTFNAFLMPAAPVVASERSHVAMTRHLTLSDDMKEYWGFYLLKGSKVTVSTCARFPGASLILIRGHRHLHECAYIGDDSSEELSELMEIVAEGNTIKLPESEESPSNRVDLLTKHRAEVDFHDPNHDPKLKENAHNYVFKRTDSSDKDEHINTKQMKELLSVLSFKANRAQKSRSNLPEEEKKERYELLKKELLQYHKDHIKRAPSSSLLGSSELDFADFEPKVEKTTTSSKNVSSKELMEGVLKKLKTLGARGERVLEMLKNVDKSKLLENDSIASNEDSPPANEPTTLNARDEIVLDGASHVTETSDINDETAVIHSTESTTERQKNDLLRHKRDLILKTSVLERDLSVDDEEKENLGIEEGYVSDGIADHHQVLNQSTLNDRSNSEFWSSFSSSEEALLNCAGLILSLPLNAHRMCEASRNDHDFHAASLANTITYTVPLNGYYFFVFSSENEMQDNYIRVNFDMHKTMYNVSNPVSECTNSSEKCEFKLDFFSDERVVFELPVKINETRWNEEFIVVSECEPRTSVYLLCVLAVPMFILFFAFQ